jgi:hypothetical protein
MIQTQKGQKWSLSDDCFLASTYWNAQSRPKGRREMEKRKADERPDWLILPTYEEGNNHFVLLVVGQSVRKVFRLDSLASIRSSKNDGACIQEAIEFSSQPCLKKGRGEFKTLDLSSGCPQQANGYDCGPYVIYYVCVILAHWDEAKVCFQEGDVSRLFRRQPLGSIWRKALLETLVRYISSGKLDCSNLFQLEQSA